MFLAVMTLMCFYTSGLDTPAEKPASKGPAGSSGPGLSDISSFEVVDPDSYGIEGESGAAEDTTHGEAELVWYPEAIDPDQFLRRTVYIEKKTAAFRVEGVSPEQMRPRATSVLRRLNLHIVTDEIHSDGGQTWAKLAGWAHSRGRKHLGLEVNISGIAGARKCLCRVVVHTDAASELQPVLDTVRGALASVSPAEVPDAHPIAAPTRTLPVPTVLAAPPEVLIEGQVSLSGGMLVFTVTVSNGSSYPLQNVDAFLISYPSSLLKLITDDSNSMPVLEPKLHEVSRFTLKPLSDSVRGELIAAVSFVTPDGRSHTVAAEPLSIVPVRGMIEPDPIEKDEFSLRMSRFRTVETTFKTEDWTPEEIYNRSMQVLPQLGFYLVQNRADTSDALLMAEVDGAARGKATHKPLVVTLVIYGASHASQTSCRIISAGEEESMIFPSIEEIKLHLEAWPCPSCRAELTHAQVQKLKSGGIIKCSSCGKTMDLARYRNWPR